MTRRSESKGQKVKTFTAHIPQPDLSYAAQVVPVYLNADAAFVIYLPEHIFLAIERHEDRPRGLVADHGGAVSDRVFETAKAFHKQACDLYVRVLREEGKTRVIRIRFAANRRGEGQYTGVNNRPERISFTGNQAVQFSFEVLWRSGERLYEQRNAADMLRDVGSAVPRKSDAVYVIEWTAEREAFLEKIEAALSTLINQLSLFMGHDGAHGSGLAAIGSLEENFARAIAGGGLPALPAPESTNVE